MSRALKFLTILLCMYSALDTARADSVDSPFGKPSADLGWILYVEGVPRSQVPTSLVNDAISAAKVSVQGISPTEMWRTGAHFTGNLTESDRIRLLHELSSLKSLPPNASFSLEENIEFVSSSVHKQKGAPLNLARLDNIENNADHIYRYSSTGKGVNVYILDKAIEIEHEEFRDRGNSGETRASVGLSMFGGGDASCAGHGTHVAGIVGGAKYGVAKDANLVMVEVQPCTGAGSSRHVIQGLDWLLDNAVFPAVAQMSLVALGESHALNHMVQEVIDAGIPFVVSAGNYGANVVNFSPAMVSDAIVVGNVDADDTIQAQSNFGENVDLFAPGVSIISASSADLAGFKYMTGTSQAAPHVSGVVAQYLERNPTASPSEVKEHLIKTSAKNKIVDTKGSPNRLLQTDLTEDLLVMPQEIGDVGAVIKPLELQPIVVFEHCSDERDMRTISVSNLGTGTLSYSVRIEIQGDVDEEWITAAKETGTVEGGESEEVALLIDASNLSQGVYRANVMLSTNHLENLFSTFPVELYVFCSRLGDVDSLGTAPMLTQPRLHRSSAEDGDIDSLSGVLLFPTPIPRLDASEDSSLPRSLSVEGPCQQRDVSGAKQFSVSGGVVDLVLDDGECGAMCSAFSFKATRVIANSAEDASDFCIKLSGQAIDVYGFATGESEFCIPVVQKEVRVDLYGVDLIYSSDMGAVTSLSNLTVISIFSSPVQIPTASDFLLQPFEAARIATVKPLNADNSTFEIVIEMDQDFYGPVQLTPLDHVFDPLGERQSLTASETLHFTRSPAARVHHHGYVIEQETVQD